MISVSAWLAFLVGSSFTFAVCTGDSGNAYLEHDVDSHIRRSSSKRTERQSHRELWGWSWSNLLYTTRICHIPKDCPVTKGPLMCGCPRCQFFHETESNTNSALADYCRNEDYYTGSSSGGSSSGGYDTSDGSSYQSGVSETTYSYSNSAVNNGGSSGGNNGANYGGNNGGGGSEVSEDSTSSEGKTAVSTKERDPISRVFSSIFWALGVMGLAAIVAAAYMLYKRMLGKKHVLSGAVAKKMVDGDGDSTTAGSHDDGSTSGRTTFISLDQRSSMDSKVVSHPGAVEVEGPISPSSIVTTKFVEMEDARPMPEPINDQEGRAAPTFAV
ncbi:hypothetical protein ACA910_002552 [Epithemia clementina (nom. ined.)]